MSRRMLSALLALGLAATSAVQAVLLDATTTEWFWLSCEDPNVQ